MFGGGNHVGVFCAQSTSLVCSNGQSRIARRDWIGRDAISVQPHGFSWRWTLASSTTPSSVDLGRSHPERNWGIIISTSRVASTTAQRCYCGGAERSSLRISFGGFKFARQNLHSRQCAWALMFVNTDSRHGSGMSFSHNWACSGGIIWAQEDGASGSAREFSARLGPYGRRNKSGDSIVKGDSNSPLGCRISNVLARIPERSGTCNDYMSFFLLGL
mmetsp:Transcript_25161/g.52316  ORF Transcript_25161/g.52316 Transcript_25161/m.52316 type:complete len:217 (-) Transcript_25161:1587-2237(-)